MHVNAFHAIACCDIKLFAQMGLGFHLLAKQANGANSHANACEASIACYGMYGTYVPKVRYVQ